MKRVLMTGAAGGIGTMLTPLLRGLYPELLLSDLRTPSALAAGERFVPANLENLDEVEKICEGVDGILHFGGYSIEGTWDQIHSANIVGCYNLFEAARRKGVKRIIFASSNHAIGFYPRTTHIGTDVTPRPDSRYGVSKVFGEALGSLYSDKHGIGVLSIRIGTLGLFHSTTAACRSGCTRRTCCSSAASGWNIPSCATRCFTVPRSTSEPGGTTPTPTNTATAQNIAPRIFASMRWPSRRNCPRTRWAISTRAAASARPNTRRTRRTCGSSSTRH